MADSNLIYRLMEVARDGDSAFENYRLACVASFGSNGRSSTKKSYLSWLAERIEEFPDGNVIATIGDRLVGQLELQIPYGLTTGYVNLFFVAPQWRRLGLGRQLHEFADDYFRSWEATGVELHVSPTNLAAVNFYRSIGYVTIAREDDGAPVCKMRREIPARDKRAGKNSQTNAEI